MARIFDNHAVTELGLPDDAELLVRTILSLRITGSRVRTRSASPSSYRLARLLALAGTAAVPVDGEPGTAPFPELPHDGWPSSEAALRRLELTRDEVRELFEHEVDRRGPYAALDGQVVAAFMPRDLWPVVELLVREGPELAVQRLTRAVGRYAKSTVPGNRHRPDGEPTETSITLMRHEAKQLVKTFAELRGQGHRFPSLQRWLVAPEIRTPNGGRPPLDLPTPRPEQVREAFASFNRRIAKFLSIRPGEDELAALARVSPAALHSQRGKVFRLLRNRMILGLLVITGGRVGAIAALMRSDYVADRQGPGPDYRRGPALRLKPGKTLAPEHVRWKPIPPAFARMIDAYLLCLERVFPQALKAALSRGSAPHPPYSSIPDDFPLLVSDRLRFNAYGSDGIRKLMSGRRPAGSPGFKPLLALDGVPNPQIPQEHRPFIGYRPHAYRRLAQQLAERGGRIWNERHPQTGGRPEPEPALYASALLDHQPEGDPLAALYGDKATEQAYEILAGRATEISWELLTTDQGARRRPDLATISERVSQLRLVESQMRQCNEAIDRVNQRPRIPLPSKRIWPTPSRRVGAEELLRVIHSQNIALSESQDLLHQRVDAGEAVIRDLLGLSEALSRLTKHRDEFVEQLFRLAYNQQHWEVIPDSAPQGAEQVHVDLRALIAGECTLPAEIEAPDQAAVRDWIILSEFAWACEIGNRSRLARWSRGEHLPTIPAHRPWETEAVPVDRSLGDFHRRIWVPAVKESFWPTATARARVAALLRVWPQKQGWTKGGKPNWRCMAPLELPEPFKERYQAARREAEGPSVSLARTGPSPRSGAPLDPPKMVASA